MNKKNDIRETFDRFRRALNEFVDNDNNTTEKSREEKDNSKDGVAYTQQDELLQTSMQTAKQQFGADFSKMKSPMFYYKNDGDVTLSGEIPSLNNAVFQFRYKDPSGCGCFFWTKGQIILSDENIRKLMKINGVYKNWKEELSTSEDIRPTDLRNQDD